MQELTSADILSPSDLPFLKNTRAELTLGGRVIAVQEGTIICLADAWCSTSIDLARYEEPIEVGDLLCVQGTLCKGRIHGAKVLFHTHPHRVANARGEAHRLLFQHVGAHLRARGKALNAVRELFSTMGFLEVETPLLVPSPGLDVHLNAVETEQGYLITSPEYQLKRLLVGGIPKVFQLARCFRKGEQGAYHNQEFTMLEWYRAFAPYEAVMEDTEQVIRTVFRSIQDQKEMLNIRGASIDMRSAFRRISIAHAFAQWANVPPTEMLRLAANDEDSFFRILVDRVEPALAALGEPVFLVDYPASQASLARLKPSDPRFAERFELYVGGVELCNGFGELTDPIEQHERFLHDQERRRAQGLPVYPIDTRFLEALEEGLPPCAGNALGVDRLLALALGAPSISAVQAFPTECL